MPRDSEETRAQLIRAGERLFAERGIEAVSLREITREAGQRNATALQYHFGDRRGLVLAILAKHAPREEAQRHEMLDELEARSGVSAREWVQALVVPAAAKLLDRDGGRDYLRLIAELMNRPDPKFDRKSLEDGRSSVNRWRKQVAPLMPGPSVDRLHRRFTALRIMYFELARRAESSRRRDDRLFASHLTDLITAILLSPSSEETSELLRERRR
ncbi:MAG: helix-turn-helix transcriptional regulator [bacterium]|nr:helix-turn-helix transcriptional regulator [bacterium]